MNNIKCPRCNKCKAIIDKIYGLLPCDTCQQEDEQTHLESKPEFYSISKHSRITTDRDNHAKDILQPFGKKGKASLDFAKAYPDKIHDFYSKDQLKKL